jgi:hypothetical protein
MGGDGTLKKSFLFSGAGFFRQFRSVMREADGDLRFGSFFAETGQTTDFTDCPDFLNGASSLVE